MSVLTGTTAARIEAVAAMEFKDTFEVWAYKYPKHYKPLPPGWVVLCDGSHCWGHHMPTETDLNIHWNRYTARRWVFEYAAKQSAEAHEVPPRVDGGNDAK